MYVSSARAGASASMSDPTASDNIKFLDSDVPSFSAAAVIQVMRELYGIAATNC